jgi:hypothetical protein
MPSCILQPKFCSIAPIKALQMRPSDRCLPGADGHAVRLAALAMIDQRADHPHAITLGAGQA